MPPGLLPAAFGDRGKARLFWPCGGGGRACTLFAKGDEQAGGADRPSAGARWKERAIGRAPGPRRASSVEVGARLPGDAERGNTRLPQQGMGGDAARIGGARGGRLDGVAALCAPVFRADVGVVGKSLTGSAARELGGVAGRPATQNVPDHGRLLLLPPRAHRRDSVLPRPGEAGRHPHVLPDDPPTLGAARCEGAPGRAVWMAWRQRSPRRAPQGELQCGGAGSVCRWTGGAGCALPRQGQRMTRAEGQPVRLAQGADERPVVPFEAESHGWAAPPRTPCGNPRVESLGRGRQWDAGSFRSASRLAAAIMVGLRPVDANNSRPGGGRRWQGASARLWESGEKGPAR
jgi:hypothetical protein